MQTYNHGSMAMGTQSMGESTGEERAAYLRRSRQRSAHQRNMARGADSWVMYYPAHTTQSTTQVLGLSHILHV
jgi:hypothetical protein